MMRSTPGMRSFVRQLRSIYLEGISVDTHEPRMKPII